MPCILLIDSHLAQPEPRLGVADAQITGPSWTSLDGYGARHACSRLRVPTHTRLSRAVWPRAARAIKRRPNKAVPERRARRLLSRASERPSKDPAHARKGRPPSASAQGRPTPAYSAAQSSRDQVVSVGTCPWSNSGASLATLGRLLICAGSACQVRIGLSADARR